MSKSSTVNINGLLTGAKEEGMISPESFQALTVVDIGAAIQMGLGVVDVDALKAGAAVLVSLMMDDSSSIRFVSGNTELMRDGHNMVLDALLDSKQTDDILFGSRYLNGYVLNAYKQLKQAVRMDTSNYDPSGGTPLYDNSVTFLGSILAKTQDFSNNGVPARSISLIVSDGADAGSRRQTAASVKSIVTDMLASENHIIAAMGVSYGSTDFYEIFSGRTEKEVRAVKKAGTLDQLTPGPGGMGIWPRWVLTPGDSKSEVRKQFQLFSQSAVRVSQSAQHFSQAAMGGFGN